MLLELEEGSVYGIMASFEPQVVKFRGCGASTLIAVSPLASLPVLPQAKAKCGRPRSYG
jgi:hypothetical protein